MKLLFENGTEFAGKSFGFKKNVEGEVVFNTGMMGYVETLTDPSYRGQILVTTYPLLGNYGVPQGLFESKSIQVAGLIVTHYSPQFSHFKAKQNLGSWLQANKIPAMDNIDTRTLTRYLREFGTVNARLITDETNHIETIDIAEVLNLVVDQQPVLYGAGDTTILVIDTGTKDNIIRSLVQRGTSVLRVPWNLNWEQYLPEIDGIFLTNGPGNPSDCKSLIARLRPLLDMNLPIFGICFGNQLLALAAGGKTQKMKYGHRSLNQPVKDLRTGKCYITSQNHGYVVDNSSLPKEWKPWFLNLNDKTNEGMYHQNKPFCSVQFHPEAAAGPNDTNFLFDEFIKLVYTNRMQNKPKTRINQITQYTPSYPVRA